MKRLLAIGLLGFVLAGCRPPLNPEALRAWQGRSLYTCCNIHYEGTSINDANYYVGSTLPFGSPATVESVAGNTLTFSSGGTRLTLAHSYGKDQESDQQYFSRILVDTDPHIRFATFPKQVQDAIVDGRVEVGMTKEQVIMSLGYPPTHKTASTDLNTWIYWYNRWITYQVQFGSEGKVTMLIGNAPTRNEAIVAPTPVPTPAKRPAHRGRSK